MQRRYRPRSLQEWHQGRRKCARGSRRNQRGMIEAAIAEACGVGRNRHQCRVTAELLLHSTDRTS